MKAKTRKSKIPPIPPNCEYFGMRNKTPTFSLISLGADTIKAWVSWNPWNRKVIAAVAAEAWKTVLFNRKYDVKWPIGNDAYTRKCLVIYAWRKWGGWSK